MMEGPMSAAQVARIFGVDPKTVTRWAKTGKLPCFRTLGGHRRFRPEDVRAMAERAQRENGPGQ